MRPHVKDARRYSPAEWPIYCEGYYLALAMSLRVMQLAAKSWEAVVAANEGPRVVPMTAKGHAAPAAEPLDDARRIPIGLIVIVGAISLFAIEVLVLLAVLIAKAAH